VRLVFLGSPPEAQGALRALHDAGHEIALVVTQPDRKRGRGGDLVPSPVKRTATELGLTVVTPERCKEALGTTVEAYGKGGIVGEAGELEQIAACLHPKFGAPTREAVGGVSILPSVKKRAAMGATLDIPLHHIKAMLVRSHFDAMEIRVPDAPAADELLLALAVSDGGRPHARVGGLKAEDAVGEDGLH